MTRRMHLARGAVFAPQVQFEFGLAKIPALTRLKCLLQFIRADVFFIQSGAALLSLTLLPVKQRQFSRNRDQYLYFCLLLLVLCPLTGTAQTLTSAGEVLDKARAAESAATQNLKTPLRRYFRLEEKSLSGATLARFGVEVWHGKEGRIVSTRFYDASNALVAGDWQLSDGTHRTFSVNQTPRIINTSTTLPEEIFNRTNVWRFPPSADGFKALLKHSRQTVVEENATSYTVDMRLEEVATSRGLVKAKLILRRADFLPVQATLLVENAEAIMEYSFNELSSADWPARETPPEAALLDAILTDGKSSSLLATAPPARPTPAAPQSTPAVPVAKSSPAPTPVVAAPVPAPVAPPVNAPAFYEVGSLQGRAIRREAPIYPKVARNAQLGGLVKVYVELDERGNIVKVNNAEGPSLLQAAAIQAARGWRFTPVVIDGRPVRAVGYILFQFTP